MIDVCLEMGAEMCRYPIDGEKNPKPPVQKASVIKAPPIRSMYTFEEPDSEFEDVFTDVPGTSNVTKREVQQYFVRQASLEVDEIEDILLTDEEIKEEETDPEESLGEGQGADEVPDFIKMTNLTHDTTFAQVKEVLHEAETPADYSRIDFSLPDSMLPQLKKLDAGEVGELSDFLEESRDAPLIASVDFMIELKGELERVAFKRLGEYKLMPPMTFAYFFRRFKADDAKYHIDNFHRNSMEFKPKRTSRWVVQEQQWIQREIEMMCKIQDVPKWMRKEDLMHVHSTVRLKKIGQGIYVMHQKTKTFGAPLCDTFVLHHVWEITQRRGLHFESYFGIEWTQNSWGVWSLGKMIERKSLPDSENYDQAYFEQLLENANKIPNSDTDSISTKRSPEERLSAITHPSKIPPSSSTYFWERKRTLPSVGMVKHDGIFLNAAVFPTEDGKFNVTIMDSQAATKRDIVGLHLYDFPKQRILLCINNTLLPIEEREINRVAQRDGT